MTARPASEHSPLPAPSNRAQGTHGWVVGRSDGAGADQAATALDAVLEAVQAVFEVDREYLTTRRRTAEYADIRQFAMLAAFRLTNAGVVRIARALKRDHNTVHHGIRRAELRVRTDPEMARDLETVRLRVLRSSRSATVVPLPKVDLHLVPIILGPCRCQGCRRFVYLTRGRDGFTPLGWTDPHGRRHRCAVRVAA